MNRDNRMGQTPYTDFRILPELVLPKNIGPPVINPELELRHFGLFARGLPAPPARRTKQRFAVFAPVAGKHTICIKPLGANKLAISIASHRHDVDETGHANTADFTLTRNGEIITPNSDPETYERLFELGASTFSGIGEYGSYVHMFIWGMEPKPHGGQTKRQLRFRPTTLMQSTVDEAN